MRSLSSLLVQREAAPMRAVEEAIARQVIHGGDLATNLLEVGAVSEAVLLATAAECFEIDAVPNGKLVVPSADVLRVLPGELALRHGLFPIAWREDERTLVLATAEPLAHAVEDDLSFALDLGIVQKAALLVRVRQAIGAAYGIPLDRRFMRLVAKIEGRADPSPSAYPPPIDAGDAAVALDGQNAALRGPGAMGPRMHRPLSVPAPTFGTGLKNSVIAPPPMGHPRTASKTPLVTGGAPAPYIPPPAAMPLALDPLTPSPEPVAAVTSASPLLSETPNPAAATPSPMSVGARGAERTRALAGVVRGALRTGAADVSKVGRDVKAPRPARRKGPFTSTMAEEELAQAQGADDVFDTFFSYANQFVVYAALFVVHGDLAEGRAANGPGATATKVASIGVPLDLPSVFARARERRGPQVGRLAADGLDAEIARDLDRTARKVAVVLPILVRARAVGLLYVDDGDEDIALASLGEVIAMSAQAGAALERIALRKKHGARADQTPLPRPVQRSPSRAASLSLSGMTPAPARVGGVEALARAVGDKRVETSVPPPAVTTQSAVPPRASPVAQSEPPPKPALALDLSLEPPPATEAFGRDPAPPPQVSPGAESVRTPEVPVLRVTDVSPGGVVMRDSVELSSLPGGRPPPAARAAKADDASLAPRAAGPENKGKAKPVIVDEDSGETISKALALYSANESHESDRASRVDEAWADADDTNVEATSVAPSAAAQSPRPVAGTPSTFTPKAILPIGDTPSSLQVGKPSPRSVVAATVREGQHRRHTQPGLGIPSADEPSAPDAPVVDRPSAAPPSMEGSSSAPPVAWPSRPPRPNLSPENVFGDRPPPSIEEERLVDLPQRERFIGLHVPTPDVVPGVVDRDRPTATARRSEPPEIAGLKPRSLTKDEAPLAPRPITRPSDEISVIEDSADPPPLALTRRRSMSEKPLPREEADDSSNMAAFIEAADRSPAGVRTRRESRPADRFDVPPRSKPISSPPAESVIVDVGAEYGALLQRTLEGGSRSQEAFAELVRHGEQAVQVLMAKFPGPLKVDRHRARTQLPAASQCGPLLELIVAIRRAALPFVTVRTSSPDIETRFWATHVLGELRYAEAANALVPRLFDDDVAVRRVARRSAAALVGAGEAGAPILQGLDHMVRSPDQPVPYRALAIETMAEIRTGAMVPPLVAVLSAVPDEVAEAARRALLVIARQDFGRDQRRWNDWWSKNGERHRIEWLIDALMHEQPAIRRAAGDELKQLTKEYFGYYDDLPRKERERAHGLYRAWWEKEGRRRFS